jgi:hypothetical protein
MSPAQLLTAHPPECRHMFVRAHCRHQNTSDPTPRIQPPTHIAARLPAAYAAPVMTSTRRSIELINSRSAPPGDRALDRRRESSADRQVDPCVEKLVEAAVKEYISSIRLREIHPRTALQSVANLLVAELSADQVCWASRTAQDGLLELFECDAARMDGAGRPPGLRRSSRPFWRNFAALERLRSEPSNRHFLTPAAGTTPFPPCPSRSLTPSGTALRPTLTAPCCGCC